MKLHRALTLPFFAFAFAATAQDLSLAARRADFATFITDFTENYAYLGEPGTERAEKPWLTWQTRYAARVDAAATLPAFDAVLTDALAEIHDFHAEVRTPTPNRYLAVPTFADIWASGPQATVTAVRHLSDAERAGILPGDRILAVNHIPIAQAIDDRLTPSLDHRDPASRDWALLSVLAGRSEETRTLTVQTGAQKPRTVTLQLQRDFHRPPGPLTASTLPGNIGLIRINNSFGDIATVAAFDRALAELRNTRALILDFRDIPSGGDSSVALGIMGRFITTPMPYQHHRIPNYGDPTIERNWYEYATPRGPFTYTAPLAVLVDHWTGSMGEGIAIGFDALHRATVIGTPMAGLAGAVTDFTLPATGARVAFPTEQLFHVNGTPRHQWKPPVLITEPQTVNNDPILEAAIRRLGPAK